jgi:hypothetical protein
LLADYLVVITKRAKVARICSTTVWTATDFSVYPIERSTSKELLQQPDEAYLLGLLKAHLFSAPFYFTYGGYNVTLRLQAQDLKSSKPLYDTVSLCLHTRPART